VDAVSLREQVTTARAAVAVAASAIAALLYLYTVAATANDAKTRARSNEEQIQLLTDLHEKQRSAEDAKRSLTISLCRQGKLKGDDCCKVAVVRGCPALAPSPPTPGTPSGGP
jgi:hypothetical protein